jgi:hypothetical protein
MKINDHEDCNPNQRQKKTTMGSNPFFLTSVFIPKEKSSLKLPLVVPVFNTGRILKFGLIFEY